MGKLLNLFNEVFNYWWACKLEIGRATGFRRRSGGKKKNRKKSKVRSVGELAWARHVTESIQRAPVKPHILVQG